MSKVQDQRFEVLDAMRGVAAMAVLFYHLRSWMHGGISFHGGYLAVDLFFLLSGFVIVHAYEDRLKHSLSVRQFMILRVVRLQPIIALGTLLGFVLACLHVTSSSGMVKLIAALIMNSLMLPAILHQSVFSLNPPAWSLFYEMVANFIFSWKGAKAKSSAIAIFVLFCLGALMILSVTAGGLDLGLRRTEALGGISRVGFSFFAGVLVYRFRGVWHNLVPAAPPVIVLGLTAVVLMPDLKGGARSAYDLIFVSAASPLLVMMGAKATLSSGFRPTALWLGMISYPLYALHAPIKHWTEYFLKEVASQTLMVICTVAVTVLLSSVVGRSLDPSVRRWLNERVKRYYTSSAPKTS